MSLGNELDDSEYQRDAVLYEAAVQMVVHGQTRESAVRTAEYLYSERMEAECHDQVTRDEDGNVVSYLSESLNPSALSSEHREAVDNKHAELCSDEGLIRPELFR